MRQLATLHTRQAVTDQLAFPAWINDHDKLRVGVTETQNHLRKIGRWSKVQRKKNVENAGLHIQVAIPRLSTRCRGEKDAREQRTCYDYSINHRAPLSSLQLDVCGCARNRDVQVCAAPESSKAHQ